MKRNRCRSLYTDQRDAELYRAFCKAKWHLLQEKGKIILDEAIELARNSRASRYFVSEERASYVLREMLLGRNPLEKMSDSYRILFSDLYDQYLLLKYEYPTESHNALVCMACATPTNSFYITPKTAISILSMIHRNKKEYGLLSSDQHLVRERRKKQ